MRQKKKILIVEDEQALAKALKFKLSTEGYEVVLAEDGCKAYELIATSTFDLILLDLVMPVKNGFEVLQEVKKNNIQANIVVLSNLGQESDIATAKSLGAKDFLIKSDTQLGQIVQKIKQFIN